MKIETTWHHNYPVSTCTAMVTAHGYCAVGRAGSAQRAIRQAKRALRRAEKIRTILDAAEKVDES